MDSAPPDVLSQSPRACRSGGIKVSAYFAWVILKQKSCAVGFRAVSDLHQSLPVAECHITMQVGDGMPSQLHALLRR